MCCWKKPLPNFLLKLLENERLSVLLNQMARSEADIAILNGVELVLDYRGALYWPAEQTLVVADMHLEKGSAFAERGQMLPPYDTVATLEKLKDVIRCYAPSRLIALGDSFHDVRAHQRMDTQSSLAIDSIVAMQETIWITGNHDPEIPSRIGGNRMATCNLGPLSFRHEPRSGLQHGEIAGHLHPVAKLAGKLSGTRGGSRARAFICDGSRLLMPAFGSFAGGLNCRHEVIDDLFNASEMVAYICGSSRVYKIGRNQLTAG